MKNKLSIYYYLILSALIILGCRPEMENINLGTTLFDYNVNLFGKAKSDTLRAGTWNEFELYIKPITENEYLQNSSISLGISSSKDSKSFFQLFSLDGIELNSKSFYGDKITIKDTVFIDNKIIIKMRTDPPNELGALPVELKIKWNGIEKSIQKSLFIVH